MLHALRIHDTGGPEILRWEEVAVGAPGEGQIRIRQTAVGLNFIDTYHRSGLYKLPLPSGLGSEAAGTVTAVGPGVTGIAVGDRVGYCSGPLGAYAEERLFPADRAIVLPAAIDDRTAAASLLQGLTAQYLLRSTFPVAAGQTILFHAAAGGVGTIGCQWAKALGATVIGTAGSPEKLERAKENGCDHVIDYGREDVVARVREITGGRGVPVVYDGVGAATWAASMDCLAPRGMLVLFGNASGPVPPIDPLMLAQKGSLFMTRPMLAAHVPTREELLARARDLFDVIASGAVKIRIDQTFPLRDAAEAHRALQARRTTGATILVP
jgi:NADPH2:quinone reductase